MSFLFQNQSNNTPQWETVDNVISQFLEAFRASRMDTVNEVLASLRCGQSVEGAGRILALAVKAAQDHLRQTEQDKQAALQSTVNQLKRQLEVEQKSCKDIKAQINNLQTKISHREEEIDQLNEKIKVQNRILVRQQEKLRSLFNNMEVE